MQPVKGNEEYKQRINLSSYAASALRQDREAYRREMPFAGFLNDIIARFSPVAKASINTEVARRRADLGRTLSPFRDEADVEAIANALAEKYRQDLLRSVAGSAFPGGESILFRLNKANFRMLYGTEDIPGMESENYARPSIYLKALFEEFTRLSTAEREAFYFASMVELVEEIAVPNGYLAEVIVGKTVFWLRPYKVMADTGQMHIYLTGLSRLAGTSGGEQIVSLRISNLEGKITLRRELPRERLMRYEILDLEARIRKTGVQFLMTEKNTLCCLRFHGSGERQFKARTNQRPIPVGRGEDGAYLFDCPARQIVNYFFSFGKDVEILDPPELREAFKEAYRAAFARYAEQAPPQSSED